MDSKKLSGCVFKYVKTCQFVLFWHCDLAWFLMLTTPCWSNELGLLMQSMVSPFAAQPTEGSFFFPLSNFPSYCVFEFIHFIILAISVRHLVCFKNTNLSCFTKAVCLTFNFKHPYFRYFQERPGQSRLVCVSVCSLRLTVRDHRPDYRH